MRLISAVVNVVTDIGGTISAITSVTNRTLTNYSIRAELRSDASIPAILKEAEANASKRLAKAEQDIKDANAQLSEESKNALKFYMQQAEKRYCESRGMQVYQANNNQ